MVLLEGLKELTLIEKKIEANNENITRYSSRISTELPLLETDDAMKAKIKSLVKSNQDLIQHYQDIKRRVDYVNFHTVVEVMGRQFTLNTLLAYQRKLTRLMVKTYESMNCKEAEDKIRLRRSREDETVKALFDEESRTEGLQYWSEFAIKARAQIELINATTVLPELDAAIS